MYCWHCDSVRDGDAGLGYRLNAGGNKAIKSAIGHSRRRAWHRTCTKTQHFLNIGCPLLKADHILAQVYTSILLIVIMILA
jgi:hypothetical protein